MSYVYVNAILQSIALTDVDLNCAQELVARSAQQARVRRYTVALIQESAGDSDYHPLDYSTFEHTCTLDVLGRRIMHPAWLILVT